MKLSYLYVLMTNIDIVNGIDCLQVLQHADGKKKYLTVNTGFTSWRISDDINEDGAWIESASAGDSCPASPANKKSDRYQQTRWKWSDGKAWQEGDIRVKCKTHS